MKREEGIPLAGGPSGAYARERASATPKRGTTARAGRTGVREAKSPASAELRSLQKWFAASVMHPVGVEASVRELGRVGSEPIGIDDVERVVRPSSALSGIERIEIYHQAYRARLVECLADDYPSLRYALGESSFEALCHSYIAEYPSRSPNLNHFGRHMSAFCRTRRGSLSAFSADLAALEWAMVEVLHQALAERLSESVLAAMAPSDWPGARFAPSRSVRVLELGYPVNAYFQAYNTDAEPTLPDPGWSATAVFRDGPTIWRMNLSRAMHALLCALYAGTCLGAALDAIAESGEVREDEASEVMVWFRDWVRYGFFASVVTD